MTTIKKHMLFMMLFISALMISCSDDDPAPANGPFTLTITDPDGNGVSSAQLLLFNSEADATNQQNQTASFSANAQGVITGEITVGNYHGRVVSTDAILLDQVIPVNITAASTTNSLTLDWDASAYVLGDWDLTLVDVAISYGNSNLSDDEVEGENYTFRNNASYSIFDGSTEVLSGSWEVDGDNSLIRLGGSKLILEAYILGELNETVNVPGSEEADLETYAVTTTSRQVVSLISAGSFTDNGTNVTYSFQFDLTRK